MSSSRSGERRLSATLRKQLAHIRACEKAGETLKEYGARRGLSVQALYEAKRRLRKQGVLAAHPRRTAAPTRSSREPTPRFVEAVRRVDAREGGAAWRLRFAGGAVLEGATPLHIDEVLRLVDVLGSRS